LLTPSVSIPRKNNKRKRNSGAVREGKTGETPLAGPRDRGKKKSAFISTEKQLL